MCVKCSFAPKWMCAKCNYKPNDDIKTCDFDGRMCRRIHMRRSSQ
jgi:hypothetical protein